MLDLMADFITGHSDTEAKRIAGELGADSVNSNNFPSGLQTDIK